MAKSVMFETSDRPTVHATRWRRRRPLTRSVEPKIRRHRTTVVAHETAPDTVEKCFARQDDRLGKLSGRRTRRVRRIERSRCRCRQNGGGGGGGGDTRQINHKLKDERPTAAKRGGGALWPRGQKRLTTNRGPRGLLSTNRSQDTALKFTTPRSSTRSSANDFALGPWPR